MKNNFYKITPVKIDGSEKLMSWNKILTKSLYDAIKGNYLNFSGDLAFKYNFLASLFEDEKEVVVNYNAIFSKASSIESLLNKDIYNFNEEESIVFLQMCEFSKKGDAQDIKDKLMYYVNFAMDNGLTNKKNYFEYDLIRHIKPSFYDVITSDILFNIIKEKNIFGFGGNYKIKYDFLRDTCNDYSESTLEQLKSDFSNKALTYMEELTGRDLYDFDYEDMKLYLLKKKYGSEVSIQADRSKLKNYIDYAKSIRNFGINKENVFNIISSAEMLEFINRDKATNKYITRDELFEEYLPKLKNAQDKVYWVLAWNGIWGKNYDDMLNLRQDQFNYKEGTITLHGNIIQLDKLSTEIIDSAIDEMEYMKYGKEGKEGERGSGAERVFDPNNPYIIKGIGLNPLDSNAIKRRVVVLRREGRIGHMSVSSVYTSGIAWKLLTREIETGVKLRFKDIVSFVTENEYKVSPQNLQNVVDILREKHEKEIINN